MSGHCGLENMMSHLREPMIRRGLSFATTLLALHALVSGQAGRDRRADFEGVWDSATATPIERPRGLKGKGVFSPQGGAAWEQQAAKNNEDPPPDAPRRGTGTYNAFFREFGTAIVKTGRTSIVVDPPDERISPPN